MNEILIFLKNKREAKFLFKIHEEILGNYSEKMKHIDLKTQITYSRIVSQFLAYSPSFDPEDLERFLTIKFNLSIWIGTINKKLRGTVLNYYNCIKGFLKIVYSTEYSILSSDYANSFSNISEDNKSSQTLLEMTNAYVKLIVPTQTSNTFPFLKE